MNRSNLKIEGNPQGPIRNHTRSSVTPEKPQDPDQSTGPKEIESGEETYHQRGVSIGGWEMKFFFCVAILGRNRWNWLLNWETSVIWMENGDNHRCVFPLTSLQIGDLQSYLSHLSLFLTTESNKFYILVDNRPWLEDMGSRRAHLWQLMVTKSRSSPFANTKARKRRKDAEHELETRTASKGSSGCSKNTEKWFSLINAAMSSQKKALLPMKKLKYSLQLNHELHRTLFGLIVFEVAWTNVRGINYLNELQTDTSVVIETKFMKRWEFDNMTQAVRCMPSWFSGTHHEQNVLREYLLSLLEDEFYDAQEDFFMSNLNDVDENSCFYDVSVEDESSYGLSSSFDVYPATVKNMTSTLLTPPPPNTPNKRRKVTRTSGNGAKLDTYSKETAKGVIGSLEPFENTIEATVYRDVLILFRFNDRDLPFKMRDIIVSDLRLLTLLESGLPSWVIFLQSYPVFCHLYRPWMCPLARVLYVMISVVTVLIGFYDLYKNVPLLKATASHLFGPLFHWIETWEMISRIKYLGTMLFLHNFEKAVQWFLMISCTIRSFFSVLAEPMVGPLVEVFNFLLPFWNTLIQVAESFFSVIWILACSSCKLLGDLIEIMLLPIWFILSFIWSTATFIIFPIFWVFMEILYAPIRLIIALASFVAFVCTLVYEMLGEFWVFASSMFHVASAAEATMTTYETTMWRSLWQDLFSQVFRALRSILNGFVAFFAACNRHRLSIYNHLKELIQRLSCQARRSKNTDPHHRRQTSRTH
ncbi:hypothetical protein Nepgr_000553 [Nepenthes gracilis]|uniref:Uncharacterized protein n=1 Tax=Nepenthes gracilis TaxID=150966 RepID=A0AAD3RWB0_NEPGR|nr:hypothetical protein Nepgr_000553 [Nepenthes gracilis]